MVDEIVNDIIEAINEHKQLYINYADVLEHDNILGSRS